MKKNRQNQQVTIPEAKHSIRAYSAWLLVTLGIVALTVAIWRNDMMMVEQILYWTIGIALLFLVYRLVHKEKFTFAFFAFIASLVCLLCGTSWFQGLMKTKIISVVTVTLKDYGKKLDDFQQTTDDMQKALAGQQKQLDAHQKEINEAQDKLRTAQMDVSRQQMSITNQCRDIREIQSQVSTAQTNLNNQQKQIGEVEYLVNNLFSKVVFETFSGVDTNHVLIQGATNGATDIVIILAGVPIPNSLKGSVTTRTDPDGLGGASPFPQPLKQPLKPFANLLFQRLHGFTLSDTTFNFEYVKDTRATNMVTRVEYTNGVLRLDGQPFPDFH